MRDAGGTISTDIENETTTLARLMKVVRLGDGLITRFTDHDEDIILDEEVAQGEGVLSLAPDPAGPAYAVGVLSITGQPATGATVTIGANVYTFTNGALDATGKVLIGVDVATTTRNLRQAIVAGTGAGAVYATGTTAHPLVTADIRSLTYPSITESVLVTATGISARFSNLSANTGGIYDGDKLANHPNQPRTADMKEGLWYGVTFTAPKYITHAVVYGAMPFHNYRNRYDHVVGWWFGLDANVSVQVAQQMMQDDGFDV